MWAAIFIAIDPLPGTMNGWLSEAAFHTARTRSRLAPKSSTMAGARWLFGGAAQAEATREEISMGPGIMSSGTRGTV